MQDKKSSADISIRYIKGVGPKRALVFQKLGIETVSDLFYYLPRRYEDRTNLVRIKDLKPGLEQAVLGKIVKCNIFTAKTGRNILDGVIDDGTGHISAVWYNMPFLRKTLPLGAVIFAFGQVDLFKRLQMTHPSYEIVDENKKDISKIAAIFPVYSLTEDLTQRYLRNTMDTAIHAYLRGMQDPLPTEIRARKKLVDLEFAVKNIHFPQGDEHLARAYHRLVFEEFFILQAMLAIKKKKYFAQGLKHIKDEGLLEEFESLFDFKFTDEQKKCIKEIEDDMASGKAMYRLLQGDVGSGKTVVAMFAMLMSVRSGFQAVMMAPTEILARQHYVTVSKILMPLGVDVRLIVQGIDKNEREVVIETSASGTLDVLIGTHALLGEKIKFKSLGLVVIDEQHKFGVEQRKALRDKNTKAATLVMTATPIPRSLAMTFYGDMDISYLKGKPLGREPVVTYWVGREYREKVYKFVLEELASGRQAFIVYPRIKETDSSDIPSIENMFGELKNGVFKDKNVGMLHGRMVMEEKDKTMKLFKDKKIDVLVATTVVEVGIDVPNATVMIIEHADRYGLAQLHQLRGRIGRGKHTSYCILIGDPKNEISEERLESISGTSDGFEIAEKDLENRGPGEFLGSRQSGLPEIRFGNIIKDYAIMKEAREEAFNLVQADPSLADSRHAGIKACIRERFKGKA
ncbi:MAG: ATP-dependent DNA helicase RecG [Candidatus Omnitrophica bacterium]|nr:ATP-dependent DNA helicase RecG [Candidatus Omnitrophota bacterium]